MRKAGFALLGVLLLLLAWAPVQAGEPIPDLKAWLRVPHASVIVCPLDLARLGDSVPNAAYLMYLRPVELHTARSVTYTSDFVVTWVDIEGGKPLSIGWTPRDHPELTGLVNKEPRFLVLYRDPVIFRTATPPAVWRDGFRAFFAPGEGGSLQLVDEKHWKAGDPIPPIVPDSPFARAMTTWAVSRGASSEVAAALVAGVKDGGLQSAPPGVVFLPCQILPANSSL